MTKPFDCRISLAVQSLLLCWNLSRENCQTLEGVVFSEVEGVEEFI